jgi:hypothetical protein
MRSILQGGKEGEGEGGERNVFTHTLKNKQKTQRFNQHEIEGDEYMMINGR